MNEKLLSYKKIQPGKFQGKLSAPPSKSVTHRLLILAALSGQPCEIENILLSEDTLITIEALSKMGFRLDLQNNSVIFSGERRIPKDIITIDFGNSGTSARLLTAVAAITPGNYFLTGSNRMMQRPMLPLIQTLSVLGAHIEHDNGFLPISLSGGTLSGRKVTVDASQSSQFVSALMLIAPHTRQGLKIIIDGPIASESYIHLTRSVLENAGMTVKLKREKIDIPGRQFYKLDKVAVEGDYSSISYFAVGAAISKGDITIQNLSTKSAQGDRAILDIIKTAGGNISHQKEGCRITAQHLRGFEVEMINYLMRKVLEQFILIC